MGHDTSTFCNNRDGDERTTVEKMKTFKSYINEAVQWQSSVSRMIFDIGSRITDLKFPTWS